jgi:hypothetical protein
MKLNVTAFGMVCGIFWGVCVFTFTWWMILMRRTYRRKTLISTVYRGYEISPRGSIIGALWGAADGFLTGLLFAGLYNLIAGKE